MHPLEKALRSRLERTIERARQEAEAGAVSALEQLGVQEAAPYKHLSKEDRVLRRKLRAHARHLGNGRNAKGEQEIDRLIEEVAYEHWHRMLFARYLAENNLLIYPDPVEPVSITLEECQDLAADEGATNGWELASRYAARMLPQIFRPDSPVFELTLPPENQQRLERLVEDLPREVFTASDSLGWVYQFWQSRKKEEVNASEVKIGAKELPAVTQLFTEPYMVAFLLDNSLGAWWVKMCSEGSDQPAVEARNMLQNAQSEDELRVFFSRPGFTLSYLRFVKDDESSWTPAGGTFDNWPDTLKGFKTLDPCCGSGHFLIAQFLMLVPMRMELEGLSAREAVDKVLAENIHGLEIDQRCVQLAAFSLALAAWTYPGAGGYRPLPELNLACSGLAINARKEEWLNQANGDVKLKYTLDQ
ncbi:DNA methyltransferase, partial [Desulfonatronospira sp. MSAO_Bac3]|uniref:DNA methyltransferase n=1 Tax=Desulfonatronospira sp. MSAO_Bac3 TaxID=2293857 RepID=UPI000FF527CF